MDMGETMSYDYYNKYFQCVKIDPYRIAALYDVQHPALFQALKKILRGGSGQHKASRQDIVEARDALGRWLEMWDEEHNVVERCTPNLERYGHIKHLRKDNRG